MVPDIVASTHRRVSEFLQGHPYVRVFAMPIVLMAAILLGLFLAVGNAPVESFQVVGLFVIFSAAVVSVAMVAEKTVEYVTASSSD